MRTRAYSCHWSDAGSPSFRYIPFARDVFFDPGRATTPRTSGIAHVAFDFLHSLRPRDVHISWLNRHPMQSLRTLRGRRYRRLTQHLLPGGSLGLTRAGLSPAGLHQLWLAPSQDCAKRRPSAVTRPVAMWASFRRLRFRKFPFAAKYLGARSIEPHDVVPALGDWQAIWNLSVAAAELHHD